MNDEQSKLIELFNRKIAFQDMYIMVLNGSSVQSEIEKELERLTIEIKAIEEEL